MHYRYITDLFRKGCLFKQFSPLDFHQGNGVFFFKFILIRVQMNGYLIQGNEKKYSQNVSRSEMGKQTTQDRRRKKGNLKFVSTVFPRIIAVPRLITSIIAPRPPPPSTHTPLAFFSFFNPLPAESK